MPGPAISHGGRSGGVRGGAALAGLPAARPVCAACVPPRWRVSAGSAAGHPGQEVFGWAATPHRHAASAAHLPVAVPPGLLPRRFSDLG
jgi:hypothetical protein